MSSQCAAICSIRKGSFKVEPVRVGQPRNLKSNEHYFICVVGEHNHVRNPEEDLEGVWCYTTDLYKKWEHCSVPVCVLKVLDFSADNDQYDVRLGSLFFEHLTEYIRRMSTGPIS